LATAIPARLSAREGRKFGLTVGGAFLVLAAILFWRGRWTAPLFAGLGALLVIAGSVIPTRLGPANRAWMKLAHLISKVTTPIFMGVVYFLVLAPIGLLMRAFGRNPMSATRKNGSFWVVREPADGSHSMKRQF
jgi:hypothetical protein